MISEHEGNSGCFRTNTRQFFYTVDSACAILLGEIEKEERHAVAETAEKMRAGPVSRAYAQVSVKTSSF